MCDLFALSAVRNYSAPKTLPVFAAKASRNMDGWGIGFFKKNRAHVEKSAAQAYYEGRYHDGFQRIARLVSSKFIIAHVRLRTSGPIDECHAHPFVIPFRGQDWLFAHNGKSPSIVSYLGKQARLIEAVSDSARIFEYLVDGIADRTLTGSSIPGLFTALADVSRQLCTEFPGNYNYLLTNGCVLFVFSNYRQIMLLKESRNPERGMLLTTVEQGLSQENWMRLARRKESLGILLAILGSDILLKSDI